MKLAKVRMRNVSYDVVVSDTMSEEAVVGLMVKHSGLDKADIEVDFLRSIQTIQEVIARIDSDLKKRKEELAFELEKINKIIGDRDEG